MARQLPGLFPGLCWGLVTRLSSVTQARDHHRSHRQHNCGAVQVAGRRRPCGQEGMSKAAGVFPSVLGAVSVSVWNVGLNSSTCCTAPLCTSNKVRCVLAHLCPCWCSAGRSQPNVCSCAVHAGWAHCSCAAVITEVFISKPDLSLSHCNSPLCLPCPWQPPRMSWPVNLTTRGQSCTGTGTPGDSGALPVASCP